MNNGILIIGSGFAARQLVKNLRKQSADIPLTLIAADSMDEYNKPDLSHVISQGLAAGKMTRQTAGEFAEQYQLSLFPNTRITAIDAQAHTVSSGDKQWYYDKLVLATGASSVVPPVPGHELMLTLNSQQAYCACESRLRDAQRVAIVGGGLIGCELAMDFCLAGKAVTLVDSAASVLASLMPADLSSRLQHKLTEMGVHLLLNSQLQSLEPQGNGVRATFDCQRTVEADVVVAAAGLRPETTLARCAGAEVNRGIKVDSSLQTSKPDIWALGDCAEIDGQLMPYLQPIQLSAMALAKSLSGNATPVHLPPMLVKIKTPALPMQLAGETSRRDLQWHITAGTEGMVARGCDIAGTLRAFVVSEARLPEAFGLLKSLSTG